MAHPILTLRRWLTGVLIKAVFRVSPDPPMTITTKPLDVQSDLTRFSDVKVYGPGGDRVWPTR